MNEAAMSRYCQERKEDCTEQHCGRAFVPLGGDSAKSRFQPQPDRIYTDGLHSRHSGATHPDASRRRSGASHANTGSHVDSW